MADKSERTYAVVKDELDKVDLEDDAKVNSLIAELKGMEALTALPKAAREPRTWLSWAARAAMVIGVAAVFVGFFIASAVMILLGSCLFGLPQMIR